VTDADIGGFRLPLVRLTGSAGARDGKKNEETLKHWQKINGFDYDAVGNRGDNLKA